MTTTYPGDTKRRAEHPIVSRDRMLERQHLEQMALSDAYCPYLRESHRRMLDRIGRVPELLVAVILVGLCAWSVF